MNKKFKGFFNWNLRHDGGFTLVELIVVIAILAILAGVAIPAYSGYVTKANITADENLASEVENALILYYYSNPGTTGGWVALTPSGAKAGGAGADAMKAVFGDSWESTAVLKHDGWKMTGGFDNDMMYAVENSGFKTETVGTMVNQVQNVVEKATGWLENIGVSAGMQLDQNVVSIMQQAGVATDGTLTVENAQAAANAYFYAVAGELSTINTADYADGSVWNQFYDGWMAGDFSSIEWENDLAADAAQYAAVLAFANYQSANGNDTYLNRLNNSQEADPRNEAQSLLAEIQDNGLWDDYVDDASYDDAMAFLGYMQGVNSSKDSLLNQTNLNSSAYFTDGTVENFVNSYVEIAKHLNELDVTNGIVVSMDPNGNIAVQKGKN